MATFALTIGGVSKTLQSETLVISETANGRNTARFDVLSVAGTYRPAIGEAVVITEDTGGGAVTIFAGLVDTPGEYGFGHVGGSAIVTTVTATDYNLYADHRYVTGTIAAGSHLDDALTWLVDNYLDDYGIALHGSQAEGPQFADALTYENVLVRDVLDQLSTLTSYVWDIDYDLKLHMVVPASTAAPFNVVSGDGNALGDITVEPSAADYANRVIVRYSAAAQTAYGFFGVSANPSDGETVVIGGQTYTFKDTVGTAAGNVHISHTDAEGTMRNLANAVMGGGTPGTDYATATAVHSQVVAEYWDVLYVSSVAYTTVIVRAKGPGASGNNIAATETCSNGIWFTEGGVAITALARGADEQVSERKVANDATEQAAVGIWERIVTEASVFDPAVAQSMADAYLARFKAKPKQVSYRTRQTGVHPGQTQTITCSARGLSGTFIVTDVTIRNDVGNLLIREVTAYGGTGIPARWQDTARRIFGGGSMTGGASGMAGGFPITVLMDLATALMNLGITINEDGIVIPSQTSTSNTRSFRFSDATAVASTTRFGTYSYSSGVGGSTPGRFLVIRNKFVPSGAGVAAVGQTDVEAWSTNTTPGLENGAWAQFYTASGSDISRITLGVTLQSGVSYSVIFESTGLSWGGGAALASSDDVWRGTWISPAFDAGVYTASGSMTWTVASGDQLTYKYTRVGDTLFLIVNVQDTTVGGTPSTGLRVALPASLTAVGQTVVLARIVDNGTAGYGVATVADGGTYVVVTKLDSSNWAAATNATHVRFEMFLEVT